MIITTESQALEQIKLLHNDIPLIAAEIAVSRDTLSPLTANQKSRWSGLLEARFRPLFEYDNIKSINSQYHNVIQYLKPFVDEAITIIRFSGTKSSEFVFPTDLDIVLNRLEIIEDTLAQVYGVVEKPTIVINQAEIEKPVTSRRHIVTPAVKRFAFGASILGAILIVGLMLGKK